MKTSISTRLLQSFVAVIICLTFFTGCDTPEVPPAVDTRENFTGKYALHLTCDGEIIINKTYDMQIIKSVVQSNTILLHKFVSAEPIAAQVSGNSFTSAPILLAVLLDNIKAGYKQFMITPKGVKTSSGIQMNFDMKENGKTVCTCQGNGIKK